MSEIFIKRGKTYQDDAQFRRTPIYQQALEKSEAKMSKIVFDNAGAKSDYLRRVRAHPNNIPGMPVFFGPALIATKTYSPNDAYRQEMIAKRFWVECECGTTYSQKWGHECRR